MVLYLEKERGTPGVRLIDRKRGPGRISPGPLFSTVV